jgi:hypothetical protein
MGKPLNKLKPLVINVRLVNLIKNWRTNDQGNYYRMLHKGIG